MVFVFYLAMNILSGTCQPLLHLLIISTRIESRLYGTQCLLNSDRCCTSCKPALTGGLMFCLTVNFPEPFSFQQLVMVMQEPTTNK